VKLIAELATGHGGDLALAKDLISAAADAGCDYAKVQTYSLEKLNPHDPQAGWLTQAHLTRADHEALMAHCSTRGIQFLSTPFDADSLRMLRGLGLKTFKIASSEAHSAWWGRLKGEQWIVSYPWGEKPADTPKCITALTAIPLYPTPLECVGRVKMDLTDGWSDHCVGIDACLVAIANGARVVEAHIMIADRGRNMAWDKPPRQFADMRNFADNCETMRSGVAQRFRERWTA
jgi:N,N'-diacetyllegionaminate synthase